MLLCVETSNQKKSHFSLLDPEGQGTTVLGYFHNYLLTDTA